jgi:hypothetical protein
LLLRHASRERWLTTKYELGGEPAGKRLRVELNEGYGWKIRNPMRKESWGQSCQSMPTELFWAREHIIFAADYPFGPKNGEVSTFQSVSMKGG